LPDLDRHVTRRERRLATIGVAALVLATVGLFIVSRGKWSDAIIDSGTEWLYADALSRGQMLYRDVAYWFGPFTPYFLAVFLFLLGSSFRSLAIAGAVGSLATLFALYFALRRVTERLPAGLWTALAIPALVFMPNAGGSILGMGYRIWHPATFALLAIALASRPSPPVGSIAPSIAAGTLCALAALSRMEWGILAMGAVLVCFAVQAGATKPFFRHAALSVTTFVLVTGGVLAGFVALAGGQAVLEDGHLVLLGVSEETRAFLFNFSKIREWPRGMLELIYSTGVWTAAVLLLHVAATGRRDRKRVLRDLTLLAMLAFLLVVCAALGGAAGAVLFSAAPLACIGAAAVGWSARPDRRAALLGFGVAGILSLHRRPFHIQDGAYIGPSLLFALVCAAALVQHYLEKERDPGVCDRFRVLLDGALVALIAFAFLGRAVQYGRDDRVPIPGTAEMLSARRELVPKLVAISETIRRETRPGEGLVVFPEGGILNFLTDRRNPIRHKLFIPGYLTDANESEVLEELQRSSPAALAVLDRETSEYGRPLFGFSYGKRIRRWMEAEYSLRPLPGERGAGGLRRWTVLAIRRHPTAGR
jgi:hypothetical protein